MKKPQKPLAPSAAGHLSVEYIPIDQITDYENNPRQHTVEQIELIAKSITEFGWTSPVLIDANNELVAGHGRASAARLLDMKMVPAIRLGHLTPTQKRALVIADNKIAITGTQWDFILLKTELAELRLAEFDLALTGWGPDELAELFGEAGAEGSSEGSGAGSLAAQFGIPPFSVLNAREGWWQERKRGWLALGIESELGRGEGHQFTNGSRQSMEYAGGFKDRHGARKANATPGGGKMPAADYSKSHARGDGRGRPT